ncbi:MAG: tripartite tricarboxylate transporter substrate binding protein [Hyphomicrobiales bacterium]|nr:tripartite tricarboxylate transporter substrate binding protein [Hyphomicrobiales bacterium]
MPMMQVASVIALAAAMATAAPAAAQPYPSKPLRIVVPFAAGGAVDQLARILANRLQESVAQPVVVENRPGAGGTTGAHDVAKAAADGHTILQNTNGQAISPAIYRALPFDTLRDFIPVTQLVATSTVLVANPRLPVRSARELIALAKAKPGTLNYGMTGVGNSLHLTMEMFKRAAGVDLQAIPYRGDAPLNTALIAGEVDVAIVPLVAILPHVQAGALRALAVSSARRSPLLPDVPTLSEDAVPNFEAAGWQGWFVPAKTPAEAVNVIHREAARIIADPAIAKRLLAMGNEPVGSSPEAFAAKFRDDVARFARLVKDAGIPLQ